MADKVLALEGVTLEAPDGRTVFEGLDWSLERGARVHAAGGLGNGATALLRLCAGLAEPSAGRVLLDGTPLDPEAPGHPFVRNGNLGWVPTDGGLAVNLSLLDNIALPLRFTRNMSREDAAGLATLWLERAGLAQAAQAKPRVPADRTSWLASLARAGAKGSLLWLVDRPPGGLDSASRRAARAILDLAAGDPAVSLVLVGGDWMAGLGDELTIEDGRVSSGGIA